MPNGFFLAKEINIDMTLYLLWINSFTRSLSNRHWKEEKMSNLLIIAAVRMMVSPLKFVLKLNPQCITIKRWGLLEVIKGLHPMNWISTIIKRSSAGREHCLALPVSLAVSEPDVPPLQKMWHLVQAQSIPHQTLSLLIPGSWTFLPPEYGEIHFYFF